MKKVVAQFDKNIAAWRKKSTDDPREECITANPEEEPNTEDSMKNLLLRTLKRFLSMRNQMKILVLEGIIFMLPVTEKLKLK